MGTERMRLYLNRLHYPVTTLGPGRRVGVWFQGCTLRCPGCVSADTWASQRGETTVDAVLESVAPWLAQADGVTISGGEPFQQPDALEALLRGLRNIARGDKDILVYSGYPWEQIAPRVTGWEGLADALISEPFRAEAGQSLVWRGSDNQRMNLLTALGRARYAEWVEAARATLPQALDIFFQDGEVWMAGIPSPGTLENLRIRLAEAGFDSTTSQAHGSNPTPVFA